jgi:hypothetical protein
LTRRVVGVGGGAPEVMVRVASRWVVRRGRPRRVAVRTFLSFAVRPYAVVFSRSGVILGCVVVRGGVVSSALVSPAGGGGMVPTAS